MKLTRKFFEDQNWDISVITVDGENTTWKASLKKDIDKDGVYIDAIVTNIIYPDRFAVNGHLTSDCYVNVMLYTDEDYYNLLKLAHLTPGFNKIK